MITKVQIGSVSINDNESYGLVREEGLSLPPVRHASFNLAGEDFGSFVSAFYGSRRFALEIVVIGSSVSDFATKRAALISALDSYRVEQAITFTLADGRVVSLSATLVSLDFPLTAGRPTSGVCMAEFEAAYPFFATAGASMVTLTLGTIGGGTVPATLPMTLNMGGAGTFQASNAGTAPAFPTIRISGPVTNPTIRNVTTGKEIRFQTTLASGEYLDVDFLRKTVTDQGGTNRYATKEGEWWSLVSGTNELRLLADSSDATAKADVTYSPAYLAL